MSDDSSPIEGLWDDAMADAFASDPPTAPTVGDDPPSVLIRLEERLGKAPERVHLPDDLLDDSTQIVNPNSSEVEGGRRVGRYLLLGELARGGMGVILHGRDTDLGRDVAIKVMQDKYCEQPVLIQRFIEEAQVAGQLQHPGVIPVYEMGLDASRRPFFSMKLVRGRTLQSLLHDRRDLADDAPRMLHVFEQICQTLAYAHARRVVHRDLKPANVMVGAFGEVQVMDWGMAKVLRRGGIDDEAFDASAEEKTRIETVRSDGRGSQSLAGSVLGTPSYMPPEQAQGQVSLVDERADVFALGGVLCEILTGHPPYVRKPGSSAMDQAQSASLEPALERLAESAADPELVELARRCLEPDLRDRPRDAGVVARQIGDYLAGAERRAEEARVEAKAANLKIVSERNARRLTVALAVAALGLVVVVGGGLWWQQTERHAERESNDQVLRGLLTEAQRAAGSEDWEGARRVLARARDFAGSRATNDAMAARLDVVDREVGELEVRGAFIAELREIRNRPAEDPLSGDKEYDDAFKAYGIDVSATDALAIADKIRARGGDVAEAMVFALDDWAGRRAMIRRVGGDWRKLINAARMADDNEWRSKVRAAILARDNESLVALGTVDVARHAPGSLTLLAVGMFRTAGLKGRTAAIELLRRACRVHSDDYWVHQQLGVVLAGQFTLRDGRPSRREDTTSQDELREAEQELRIALALQPGSTFNMAFLASVMQRAGRGADAEAYLREELARNPGNESLEIGLASVLLGRGSIVEARTLLEGKAHILHAGRMRRRLRDMGVGLSDDPPTEIVRLTEQLVGRPEDSDLRCRLARLHLHMGDYEAAQKIAFQATRMEDNLGEAWLLVGRTQLERGAFQAAVLSFEGATDVGDPRMMAHELLRVARRLSDRENELAGMLENPGFLRLPDRVDLARYSLFVGQPDHAARLFKGVPEERDRGGGRRPRGGGRRPGDPLGRGGGRQRPPRHADFWFEAGLSAVLAEDYEFARTCLERTLDDGASETERRGPLGGGRVQLHRWRHDRRFAPLRSAEGLQTMSPEDRQTWSGLWARVDAKLGR